MGDVRMTTAVYNRAYDEALTAGASAMFGTAGLRISAVTPAGPLDAGPSFRQAAKPA